MKSKDDKSEDGSDQERECLDCFFFPISPARSVHVLWPTITVFYVFFSPFVYRLYLYRIYTMRFLTIEL